MCFFQERFLKVQMQVWSCEEIERKNKKDISKKRRINIGALLIQGTSCRKKEWKFYAWMEWQLFKSTLLLLFLIGYVAISMRQN